MPAYDYECDLCKFEFELRQGFDDEPVATCPRCSGKSRRVLRAVPVIFKGSGFYVTDNRRDTASAEEKQASGEGSKEGSGETSKADSGKASKEDSGKASKEDSGKTSKEAPKTSANVGDSTKD